MRRMTLRLSHELDAHLRYEAARRGMTLSEIIREALDRHLKAGPTRRLAQGHVWRSGRGDVSERVEEILRGERSH